MSEASVTLDPTLLATFAAEAQEQLDGLEQDLLALEHGAGDPEVHRRLFRAAHSFKGNSALMGFLPLSALAHHAEDVLERLSEGKLEPSRAVVRTLLQTVDALRHALVGAVGQGALAPALAAELAGLAERARGPEGAAPAPGAAASTAPHAAPTEATVRVPLSRLDRAVTLFSELSTAQFALRQRAARVGTGAGELAQALLEVEERLEEAQAHLIGLRMVPVGPLFHQSTRLVHDVCAELGKEVSLELSGEEVELDAALVERVRDPLTHLIRNALDHGLETPAERQARGKPAKGRLSLRARHDGGAVVVEVADDGRGLDRERIVARAVQSRPPEELAALSDAEVYRLILEPGFSTAQSVTALSGRGVGMDVVNERVQALRGALEIDSKPGFGVTFSLRLPLTLALVDGLSVRVGGHTCIIPREAVVECLDFPAAGAGGSGVVAHQGSPLPYLRLRALFGEGGRTSGRESLIVVRQGAGRAGLVVDALQGQTRSVMRPLGPLLQGVRPVAGASVEADGTVSLVLDVARLVEDAARRTHSFHGGRDAC